MYAVLPKGCKPSKTVSTDQTRPVLAAAYLKHLVDDRKLKSELDRRPESWELWCTDSYQLTRVPLEVFDTVVEPKLTEGPVPVEALKAIERSRGFTANSHVVPCNEQGVSRGVLYERPDMTVKYPDLAALIPQPPRRDRTLRVGLNPALLLQIAAALGAGGRSHSALVMTFDLDQPSADADGYLRPIHVTVGGTDQQGLLMPIRITV